jgi:hypothetical protein
MDNAITLNCIIGTKADSIRAMSPELLIEKEVLISMSGTGNCYNKAVNVVTTGMESFWETLKTECASHCYPSLQVARQVIFEHNEGWYNHQK